MKAKILIIAGDLYDKRNPNVEEVVLIDKYLQWFNGVVIIATGNHELRAPQTDSAIYLTGETPNIYRQDNYGRADIFRILKVGGYNIGVLNWSTLEFFEEIDTSATLQEQLREASTLIIKEIDRVMAEKGVTKLDILTGHAHIYYGLSSDDQPAPAPNLLAGRDILLPASELENRTKHLYLGHVHSSRAKHYIGSLQPTDLSDNERKGFYSLDLETDKVSRHTLPQSLKITKILLNGANQIDILATINKRVLSDPPSDLEMLLLVLDNSMLEDMPTYDYTEVRRLASESGYYQCQIQPIPPERKARMTNKGGTVVPIVECVERFLDDKGFSQDKIDKVRGAVITYQERE